MNVQKAPAAKADYCPPPPRCAMLESLQFNIEGELAVTADNPVV
jgi:hypothetical protein